MICLKLIIGVKEDEDSEVERRVTHLFLLGHGRLRGSHGWGNSSGRG